MSSHSLVKLNVTLSNIIFLIFSINVQSLMGFMEAKSSYRYFSNYKGDTKSLGPKYEILHDNNDDFFRRPTNVPDSNYPVNRYGAIARPGYNDRKNSFLSSGIEKNPILSQSENDYGYVFQPPSISNYPFPVKRYREGLCKVPNAPLHGMYRCNGNQKFKQCSATCSNQFAFKNGLKEITIKCDFNTDVWEPMSVFPDCEPITIPLFDYKKNSPSSRVNKSPALGSNFQKNNYNYPQTHHNPSKQHDSFKYYSDPFSVDCPPFFPPLNAFKRCMVERNERTCIIECLQNYQFPNGKTQHVVKCNTRTGTWGPVGLLQNCIDVSQRFCDYPPAPRNGAINCTDLYTKRICQISCFAGYIFPDRSLQKVINCNKINGVWTPYIDVKSCEPMKIKQTTIPIQFNNIRKGSLLSSGLRNSPAKSLDSKNELCKNPPSPKNGYFQCKSSEEVMLCSATCLDNFSFKYGFVEISIKCDKKTGDWDPEPGFPDCEPTCRPECLNGGQCVKRNSCLCPVGYRGSRCEHRIASKSLKSSLNQISQQRNRGK